MMELEKQRIAVEEHRIQVEEQRIISDREEREARAQRDMEREERLEQERREENRDVTGKNKKQKEGVGCPDCREQPRSWKRSFPR